ncbi:MAG TPA: RsmE family RNA methyltransferase [Candidatus Acidoferrum sp.]|nr:RsmE family RNA methyltransferase [Candidatus Acidoferrum sp.]
MRRRFFVKQFEGTRAVLEGDAAHHLGRVLRAQAGQLYELSDGEKVWLGRIEKVGRDRVEFALVEELPAYQSAADVTLLLAVVKFDAFEWAIEKATELGVSTIVPLAAARSEKALLGAAEKRAERWKKILAEASQQSRRLRLPFLGALARPEPAFSLAGDGLKLILSERPDAPTMREVLAGQKTAKAAIAIGPEGGWTDKELEAAQQSGFKQVSLGKLILRTETAMIAALASLNYAFGGD